MAYNDSRFNLSGSNRGNDGFSLPINSSKGGSGLGIEAIAGTVQAAGGIAQGLGAIFGGGPGAALNLPVELQFQLLEQSQRDFEMLSQESIRLDNLSQAYNERFNILQNIANGLVPDADQVQRLTQTTQQIVQNLADDTEADEFLTTFDREFLQAQQEELQRLQDIEGDRLTDPQFELDRDDAKARLRQDLERSGVSPEGQARALARFDQETEAGRFTRSEQLKGAATERGLARVAGFGQAAQTGFNARNQRFGILSGQQQTISGLSQAAAALQNAGLSGNLNLGQARLQNMQAGQSIFSLLGQTNLGSSEVGSALRSGLVGPGSVFDQTGIAREDLKTLRDAVTAEKSIQSARNVISTTGGSIDPARLKELLIQRSRGNQARIDEINRAIPQDVPRRAIHGGRRFF